MGMGMVVRSMKVAVIVITMRMPMRRSVAVTVSVLECVDAYQIDDEAHKRHGKQAFVFHFGGSIARSTASDKMKNAMKIRKRPFTKPANTSALT